MMLVDWGRVVMMGPRVKGEGCDNGELMEGCGLGRGGEERGEVIPVQLVLLCMS